MAEQQVIGGGAKKVLDTPSTLRRIGVGKAAKALTSKNTCKACGYGMGGQLGGMTNELGEFPSVCNKSVQAQSTDIQAPIPHGIFEHERRTPPRPGAPCRGSCVRTSSSGRTAASTRSRAA